MPRAEFERSTTVTADTAECWQVLTDVSQLVAWIGIVDDAREIEPLEHYSAVLMDRIGPFRLRADLDIRLTNVVDKTSLTVLASGEDRQVASRISVEANLRLRPEAAGVEVSVDGHYEVSGKVATMGAGTINKKATKIIDEFFDGVATHLRG